MSWTLIFISMYVPIPVLFIMALVNWLQGRTHAAQAGC